MTLARRKFFSLSAAAVALPPVPRAAWAQTPIADGSAAYADRLRFEDIDAATIEQVRAAWAFSGPALKALLRG
jgi:hypothetical protein